MNLLKVLPSLRSVSLKMHNYSDPDQQYRNTAFPDVVLPTIVDLRLSTSNDVANDVVDNILLNAIFPNLEILDISLGSINPQSDDEETDSILCVIHTLGSGRHNFTRLHTFSLCRLACSDSFAPDDVHPSDAEADRRMLLRMPALKNVSLSEMVPTPTLRLLGTKNLPLLESVSIYRSGHFCGDDILHMVKGRNSDSQGQASRLRKLVVKECSRISEKDYASIKKAMEGCGSLDIDWYEKVQRS